MASDYDFLPVSNGNGDAPLMHLTSGRIIGATVFNVDSVVNVPAKFVATVGTLLASGFIDPATKIDFKGHVSGTTLVIDAFEPGSTDAANSSGQVIVIKPNTGWANRVAQFIKNTTGFGTGEALTAASVANAGNYAQAAGTFAVPNEVISWSGLKASTMSLNMKSTVNGSMPALTNASQDLASSGLSLSFTVASNCNAMVTVSLGITSTSDYEFKPEIRLDGTIIQTLNSAAAIANAGGRAAVRGFTYVVPLTAGTRTISAGVSLSSATSPTMNVGGGSIAALVLGRVTA